MSCYQSVEVRGVVQLGESVTVDQVTAIFGPSDQNDGGWYVEGGLLKYWFSNEGYREMDGPDYETMLGELLERGYAAAAWREERRYDSEDHGGRCSTTLRGTPEQKRKFRLGEIEQEMKALREERASLLHDDSDQGLGAGAHPRGNRSWNTRLFG